MVIFKTKNLKDALKCIIKICGIFKTQSYRNRKWNGSHQDVEEKAGGLGKMLVKGYKPPGIG